MIYGLFEDHNLVVEVEGDFMHSNLEGVVTIFNLGDTVAVFSLTPGQLVMSKETEEEDDDYDEDWDEDGDVPACPEGCPDCAAEAAGEVAYVANRPKPAPPVGSESD